MHAERTNTAKHKCYLYLSKKKTLIWQLLNHKILQQTPAASLNAREAAIENEYMNDWNTTVLFVFVRQSPFTTVKKRTTHAQNDKVHK